MAKQISVLKDMWKWEHSLSQDQYQRNHVCWVRHDKICVYYETMLKLREMIHPKRILIDYGELYLGKVANIG